MPHWQVWTLFAILAFLVVLATTVICHVIRVEVRRESDRIERVWAKQRKHDQDIMMAEGERLTRAVAMRRGRLTDALTDLLPEGEADDEPGHTSLLDER